MSTATSQPPLPAWGLLMLSLLAIVVGALGLAGAATSIHISSTSVAISPSPVQIAVVLAGMAVGGLAAVFALLLTPL